MIHHWANFFLIIMIIIISVILNLKGRDGYRSFCLKGGRIDGEKLSESEHEFVLKLQWGMYQTKLRDWIVIAHVWHDHKLQLNFCLFQKSQPQLTIQSRYYSFVTQTLKVLNLAYTNPNETIYIHIYIYRISRRTKQVPYWYFCSQYISNFYPF